MTWVAFERAGRLARDRGLPAPINKWHRLATRAYRFVQQECWDPELGAYVMHPGSKQLDASVLCMPMVKWDEATGGRPQLDSAGAGR